MLSPTVCISGCLSYNPRVGYKKGNHSSHRELDVWNRGISKPSRSPRVKAVLSLLTYAGFLFFAYNKIRLYLCFSLQEIFWSWEKDDDFDTSINLGGDHINVTQWVDMRGNPVLVSSERAGNYQFNDVSRLVENGEVIGQVDELEFRDPDHFVAGEFHW